MMADRISSESHTHIINAGINVAVRLKNYDAYLGT